MRSETKTEGLLNGKPSHHQLYEKMWLYYNFFQPVMRLTDKTTGPLLPAQGQLSRIKRRFDQARTPFDRLCETHSISEQQKEQLRTLRDQVNPRQLRQEIYQLIDQIFLLPGAVPGETEDVYQTLFAPTDSQKGEGILVTLLFDWTREVCSGQIPSTDTYRAHRFVCFSGQPLDIELLAGSYPVASPVIEEGGRMSVHYVAVEPIIRLQGVRWRSALGKRGVRIALSTAVDQEKAFLCAKAISYARKAL